MSLDSYKNKESGLDILKKKIKENDLSGVFLFCGPEEYTKDHYASLIRKKVDSSPLPEFNHIFFNATNDKISDLEEAVYSLPYMWENKLIEIVDLDTAKINEADAEYYERIFSDIPDYLTILAILRNDENEDSSAKSKASLNLFINAVKQEGLVVEFETEKADKLTTWVSRHFNAKNVKFDPNVPREIINVCGTDMYILQSEIVKLTEAFSGSPLTIADVHKYCCANPSYKFFDIATALNNRDIVGAKRILESLELGRDDIPKAVGLLAKNYSDMLLVKTAINSGKSIDTIEKDTKIKFWLIRKISSSTGNIDVKTISFAITQLSNADMKLKSYGGDPMKILELAFYRICTYGRKA